MKSKFNGISFLIGVTALVAVMLWNGNGSSAVQADSSFNKIDPATVAVIDIEKITNDYLESKGSLDAVREKYSVRRRSHQETQRKLQAMEEEAEVYAKDSERYLEIRTQIAVQAGELKVNRESTNEAENRDRAKLTADVYEKARQTISDYAQEKGIDLVMLRQDGALRGMRMEDVSSNILIRSVIWSRKELDITQDILDRMK